MELVFKALADPHRRKLLDLLRRRDGRTLVELDAHLPMTRFGTMKHLRVLEAAHLVVTRRVGREKLHYLNPIPIRRIHDRWISRYAQPVVEALGRLKSELEEADMSTTEMKTRPRHVYEVYIRTTPEKLWQAITDPSFTERYFYGTRVESSWKARAPIRHVQADGAVALEGTILEADPPHRLVHGFRAVHNEKARGDRESRVTWEIERRGEVCKLTLVHDDFDGETETYRMVGSGWNPVLSGLKTLLETGRPLEIAPGA